MMTYPEGLIKSTVHAAAISVHLFPVAGKMILLGIKKACGYEAIGETVALPDRLLSSCLAVAKVRRKSGTAKYFAGKILTMRIINIKTCCRA